MTFRDTAVCSPVSILLLLVIITSSSSFFTKAGVGAGAGTPSIVVADAVCDSVNTTTSITISDASESIRLVSDTDGVSYSSSNPSSTSYYCNRGCLWTVTCPSSYNPVAYRVNTYTAAGHFLYVKDGSTALGSFAGSNTNSFSNPSSTTTLTVEFDPSGTYCSTTSSFQRATRRGWTIDIACLPDSTTSCDRDSLSNDISTGTVAEGETDAWTYTKLSSSTDHWLNSIWRAGQDCQYTFNCSSTSEHIAAVVLATPVEGMTPSSETTSTVQFGNYFNSPFSSLEPWGTGVVQSPAGTSLELSLTTNSVQGSSGRDLTIGYVCLTGANDVGATCASPNRTSPLSLDSGSLVSDPDGYGSKFGVLYRETCSWTVSCATATKQLIITLRGDAGNNFDSYVRIQRSDNVQYVWNAGTQTFMVAPGVDATVEFKNNPSSSTGYRVGYGWTLDWQCEDAPTAPNSASCPLVSTSNAKSVPDTSATIVQTDSDGHGFIERTINGINCTFNLNCQDVSKKYMIVSTSGSGLDDVLTLTPTVGSSPTITSSSSARYSMEATSAVMKYDTISLSNTASTSSRTSINYGATISAYCSNTNCQASATPDGIIAGSSAGGSVKTDSDGVGSLSRNSGQQACEWTVTCPITHPYMSLDFSISLNSGVDFSLKLPNGSSIYERNQTSYTSRTESRGNFFRLGACSSSSSYYRRSCEVATERTTIIRYSQRSTNSAYGATVDYKCWPQTCAWSSNINDYTIQGSTTRTTYFANYNRTSSTQYIGEKCSWTLECPVGSWIGATSFGYHLRSGMEIKFYNITEGEQVMSIWSTDSPSSFISSGTQYFGKQWLAPNARKMRLDFSRGTSSSQGYGFSLSFKCYTSTCPTDLKPRLTVFSNVSGIAVSGVANYGSPTSRGFYFNSGAVVPGTTCTNIAKFACPDAQDRLVGWYSHKAAQESISVTLASTKFRNTQGLFNFGYAGKGRTGFNNGNAVGTDNIFISVSRSIASGGTNYADDHAMMQVFCQPLEGDRCYSPTRAGVVAPTNGNTLTLWSDPDGRLGQYIVPDHDQICRWNVSCPSGTTEVRYTGQEGSSSSSYTSAGVFVTTSRFPLSSFTSSLGTYTYSGSGNTSLIYQHTRSVDSDVNGFSGAVQCLVRVCQSSPNRTLSGNNNPLLVPSNGTWSLFLSDPDGAGLAFSAASTYSLEGCQYDLQCQAGFYLQLNVTGRFSTRSKQRVTVADVSSTTSDGYTYTGATSTLSTISTPMSLLTGLNRARLSVDHEWYSTTYNSGVTVAATCSRVQRSSCPIDSNYFSQLATGGRSALRLDFEGREPFPAGLGCSWSLKCPDGEVLKATSSSSARPTIRIPGSTRSYTYMPSGYNSATLTWSSGSTWTTSGNRGLDVTISCVEGPPATPAPTAPVVSASGASTCPYKKIVWEINGAERQRIVLRFPYKSTVQTCPMVFRCPDTHSSMSVKMVLSRSRGLSVFSNASNELSTVDLDGANPVAELFSSSSTRDRESIITPGKLFLLIKSIRRTSLTKLGLLMTCMRAAVPVPERVNYLDGSTTRSTSLTVTSSSYKSYSLTQYAVPRRQFSANTNRAFLISCPSTDLESDYERVSLSQISGFTSEGDLLTVTNLDNQMSQTFSGSLSRSYSTSASDKDSESVFHVSSQFYINWAADSETLTSEQDVSITYRCNSADFTVSGAGEEVETEYSTSTSSSDSTEFDDASSSNTGLIVGVVFGSVAMLMVVGCLVAACCRGNRSQQNRIGMVSVAEPAKLPPTTSIGGLAFSQSNPSASNPVEQFANTWGTANGNNVEMNTVAPQPAAQAAPAYPQPPAYTSPPSYPSGPVQSSNAWGDPWSGSGGHNTSGGQNTNAWGGGNAWSGNSV